jgi:hypothetical protein
MTDSTMFPPRCCKQDINADSVQAHLPTELLSKFLAKTAKMQENIVKADTEEAWRVLELAKKNGWQRCYNCLTAV